MLPLRTAMKDTLLKIKVKQYLSDALNEYIKNLNQKYKKLEIVTSINFSSENL